LRLVFIFIIIFVWVSACGPTQNNRKRYTKPDYSKAYKKKSRQKSLKAKQKESSKLSSRTHALMSNSFLPTILNEKDQTLMILIKQGKYLMGVKKITSQGTDKPEKFDGQRVALNAFYIDRTEVTVLNFKKFQPRYNEKPFTDGKSCPQCPAMGINWNKAHNYCKWAGKRLPSEAEWEAAARGHSALIWPWGNKYQLQRANLFGTEDGHLGVAPVGSFSQGSSPYGTMDMAGNVWEWVQTDHKGLRIAKGGGWTSYKSQSKISFRNKVDPKLENPTFGFRCAR